MKKNVFGRKLKRDKNERTALFKGLISAFVLHGRIKTTEAKAKAIKGRIDKLVTRAKTGKDAAGGFIAPFVSSKALVQTLLNDIAPRFAKRTGGYTRIIKLGRRMHDSAQLVVLEWVEGEKSLALETKKEEKPTKKEKKEVKVKKPAQKKEKSKKNE